MAPLCSFPGCEKPTDSSDGQDSFACGELHHLQLMCLRYCLLHPQCAPRLSPFFNLGPSQTCALDSCALPCTAQHLWCTKSHYLDWLKTFYQSLNSSQFCRLPGCHKHVVVELEPSAKVHDFCCWSHRQKYHILDSMAHMANRQEPHKDDALSQHGNPSFEYIIHALKEHVHNNAELPKNVTVDENFFSKHPWEVIVKPEVKSCLFVTRHNFKGKAGAQKRMKNRTTKDDYHWKPTGHPIVNGGVTKKYLTYKRISRAVGLDEANERCFSMTEYTADDLQDYCVINLYRGRDSQTSQKGNSKKKQKRCLQEEQKENSFMLQKNDASDSSSCIGDVARCLDMKDGNGNNGSSPLLSQNNKDHNVSEQDDACEPGTSPNGESSLVDGDSCKPGTFSNSKYDLDDLYHFLLSEDHGFSFHDLQTCPPIVGSDSMNFGFDLLEP